MPRDLMLKTPLLRAAVRVWGPEAGQPVLALHGWLDNAATFDRLAPKLADCRVYAIDLPGHGRSQHRAAGSHYHFVDFVADVVAVARSLRLQRYTLLGHSLGGGIACFVAAAFPEQVERLITIEALGPQTHDESENPEALRTASQQLIASSPKPKLFRSRDEAIRARMSVADFDEECAALLAARNLKQTSKGWRWRYDPALKFKSPVYLTEHQVQAHLKKIVAPTLLLLGESGYHTEDRLQSRAGVIADLTSQMIPGGHHPHLEQPAAAADAINRFMRRQA